MRTNLQSDDHPRRPSLPSRLGLGALALLFAIASPDPGAAQNRDRDGELAKVEASLRARAAEERRLKDEAKAREKEVAALRAQMIAAADALQSAERKIAEISEDLARLDEEEAVIGTSLLVERDALGDVLAALQSFEMSRPPALLISPDDANKAARAAMLLAGAAPEIEKRAADLRAKLDRLTAIRAERDRERAAFEKTNEEIRARRGVLAEVLARKQQERDLATRLAAAAQQETAALAARATSLRELIDRLDRLATAIVPRLKPPAPKPDRIEVKPKTSPPIARIRDHFEPSAPFSKARGALSPPVVGALAGKFGAAKPEGGEFEGVRFAVRDQAIVTAPYEASIAFARPYGPIGNVVILDVGAGYHVLLIGVSALLVEEGQTVAAGEPVGSMNAETAGGEAYLDFEIRKNSAPLNPALWLARQASG